MFISPKRTALTLLVCSALPLTVLLFGQTAKHLLRPVVAAPMIAASNNKASLANVGIASPMMTALSSCTTPSFGAATSFGVGTLPESVAVGDFNGDGKPDLAVANYSSNNVSVRLGTGTGSFGAVTNFTAGTNPASVTVGET